MATGQTLRIHPPGTPSWPIPVERASFDEAQVGFGEGDEAAVLHAIAASG